MLSIYRKGERIIEEFEILQLNLLKRPVQRLVVFGVCQDDARLLHILSQKTSWGKQGSKDAGGNRFVFAVQTPHQIQEWLDKFQLMLFREFRTQQLQAK